MSYNDLDATDVEAMKRFYREELGKTVSRLEHIKSVLNKLGDESIRIEIAGDSTTATKPTRATTTGAKRGRKKKRGPKSVWEDMILKRLKAIDRPLTYEQLTDDIMHFSNLTEDNRKKTKASVVSVVFRLRTKKKKIDTFSTGSREKYIALRQWFDDEGKITEAYRSRVLPELKAATTEKNKPKRPVGRPPKKKVEVKAKRPVGRPPKNAASGSKTTAKKKRSPGRPAKSGTPSKKK